MRTYCYDIMIEMPTGLRGGVRAAQAADPLPSPKGPVLRTIFDESEQADVGSEARFDRGMSEILERTMAGPLSFISAKRRHFEGAPLRLVLENAGGKGASIFAMLLTGCKGTIPSGDSGCAPVAVMQAVGQVLKPPDKGLPWGAYPGDADPASKTTIDDARRIGQLNRLHLE